MLSAAAFGCAAMLLLRPGPSGAHVIAGNRVFPVTLTFDDPGVSDEASFPAFTYQRSGANGGTGPGHDVDLGFEYDKTITETTALIFNWGYDINQTNGSKTETGFENLTITGKWQAYTNAAHEFVTSLGIIREMGGNGTGTIHAGADALGSTAPTGYFGKGLGDLPIGLLRPLAVTGELGYTIADKALKAYQVPQYSGPSMSPNGFVTQFNNGSSNAWSGGLSIQYSIPYLQSQVQNVGLNGFLGNLIPLVEFTGNVPTTTSQQGTSWIAAPGVIYLAQWGEVGLEALIPLNKAAGTNVGVVGLVHFFFDDLYPNTIGKPIFQ